MRGLGGAACVLLLKADGFRKLFEEWHSISIIRPVPAVVVDILSAHYLAFSLF